MPGRIFIYFRSADSDVAQALFRKLADRYSERQTFLMSGDQGVIGDLELTPPDVVVVVIGPGWLAAAAEGLGLDLASAMATPALIIPVLVGGALVPGEIYSHVQRFGVAVRTELFDADCQRLIAKLEAPREAASGMLSEPSARAGLRSNIGAIDPSKLSAPVPSPQTGRSPSGNPQLAIAELQSQHAQRRRVAAHDELAPAEWLHHHSPEATLRSPPAAKPAAVAASQVERPLASPSMAAPPAKSRTRVAMWIGLAAAGLISYQFGRQIMQHLPNAADLLAVLGLGKGSATLPLPGIARDSAKDDDGRAAADLVDCSVFAPPAAQLGQPVLLQVFLHLPEQAKQAAFLAQTIDDSSKLRGVQTLQAAITRGAKVQIVIDGCGLSVDEPVQMSIWRGQPVVSTFSCLIPASAAGAAFNPVVRLVVDGKPVGRIVFQIKGLPHVADPETLITGRARRYEYAFLSYARPDRPEVLKRAQALKAAGVGFFQDLLSLDPGDRWERKLYEKIDAADLFMLFQSRHANASPWVQKEWDYALARQRASADGLPDIVPVMLESHRNAPPPVALSHLHFNDTIQYLIAAEDRTSLWSWLFRWR